MGRITTFLIFGLSWASCHKAPATGYQNKSSYFPTENIEVYLASEANSQKKISLYDVNDKEIETLMVNLIEQPKIDNEGWYDIGFQYKKTFDFVPSKLKSGIYYFETSSPFVIKNPKKKNDVLVVYPSNTVNAYNAKGGRSTYTTPIGVSLSRKRPVDFQKQSIEFFKWLPNQNFQVDYISDEDLDDYENIKNYKLIIIPGHSEYWTRKGRRNFDKFVNEGGNALILSGNTMWKQVRYEGDKVVCFNQFHTDSLCPDTLRTSNYGLKQLNYPIENSIGVSFVEGGYGTKEDKGWDGYKIVEQSILLENTGLQKGDVLSVPSEECDGAKLVFKNNEVMLDTNFIHFYKQRLIGYDFGFRIKQTTPSFIVFQKGESSGVVINVGSNTWCEYGFTGKHGKIVKQITTNSINFLLQGRNLFD